MFTVNGSVFTVGPDNILPIDTTYDFQRYCHKFLLQNNNSENFIIKDNSPYNNHINYLNIFSSLQQNQNSLTSKPAFYFDGESSYLSSTCNNIITLNKIFTISFWINTNISSLQNNIPRCIFGLGNNTTGNLLCALFSQNGTSASPNLSIFNITKNQKTAIITNSTKNITDGNWHHIEISRDINNLCKLFIDGEIISSNTSSLIFGNHYTDYLRIGSFDINSGYFNGYLSDFYILDGIVEHTKNFEPNNSQHLLPLDSEARYSGMITHVQINEDVKKYNLLYYNHQHRSYMIADAKDINKLPVQGIAIEDGSSGSTIKMLTYGTLCLNSDQISDENQEYNTIIPMTQNENDSFIVSSTSGNASNLITFDNHDSVLTENNYYLPGTCQNHQHHWIKIKLNESKIIKFYSIKNISNKSNINWKLKASTDGNNWVLLDSKNNESFIENEIKLYSIENNETEYLYYEFYDMDHNYLSEIHLLNENKEDVIPTFGKLYFTITADTNDTNCQIYKISDDNDSTYWSPANNLLTGTIICDFGQIYNVNYFDYVTVNKFSITCNNTDFGNQIYVPSVFELFGSNNNDNWDLLYHFDHKNEDIPWTNYGEKAIFNLEKDTHYRYYKLIISSCTPILNGNLPNTLKLVNFELLNNDKNIIPIDDHYKRRLFKSCSKQVIVTDNNSTYNPDIAPGNVFNYSVAVLNNSNNFYPRWSISKTPPFILNIDFGENNEKEVNSYSITIINSSNYPSTINGSYPKNWTLQGSNNNSTWDTLDTQSNINFGTTVTLKFNINSSKSYRYYKLNITNTSVSNQLSIAQIHLYDSTNNDIISCGGYGKYFYTEYEDYFNFKQAQYSIDAPERSDTQNNCKANQLLNNSYSFNSTDEKWHQYCTNDNELTPTITITFPDSLFSMWNNLIDGYVIRSGINVINPKSYRYPSKWTIEGLRKYWDLLDSKSEITFNPNERKCFKLDSEQIGIKGIRINIIETLGSTDVIPPNYLHLMEFYPTYKDQKLDLPIFNGISKLGTNTKILNNSICYSNDETNIWECAWSSSTSPFFGHNCLNYLNDEYWAINNTALNAETYSQFDIKDSIHINTKNSKTIIAYGIYLAQHSLSGNKSYSPIISWSLYGSNDNVNWELLHQVNPLTEEEAISSWPIIYELKHNTPYKFYKFDNIDRGCIRGIDFYTNTNIINSKKLTISCNNKGQIANFDKISINNQLEKYYVQNLGYTGLTFKSAIDEYSVVYFDFNKQIEVVNPNVGEYLVSDSLSGNIGHTITDGPIVTLLCDSLHIFPDQILTCAANRCRGLRIIVKNDCVIDGTISMTGKGSFYSPLWKEDFPIIDEKGNILGYIPRYGASGAIDTPTTNLDRINNLWTSSSHTDNYRQYGKSGISGMDGVNRQTGGGGSGAAISGRYFTPVRGGNGGSGTCFGGGSGGGSFYCWGGGNSNHNLSGIPGINNSGIGGSAYATVQTYYDANGTSAGIGVNYFPGVPGAGVPTGMHFCRPADLIYSACQETGSGGLIILIVYGNLWLNLGASIVSNGIALNSYKNGANSIIGGAGSGGGSINIFYGGLFINNGLISAAGGLSSNIVNGGKGGDGCITIDKLN